MTTPTTHAEVIAWHAMDITHGCHLNADRADGALGFLTEAADYVNADPDVVAEVGIMPLPTGFTDDGTDATTVHYADGSAIRFGWDADGYAEVMALLPSVDAEPTATYR